MNGLNKALKKGYYDLVITDYHLRWSTGLDVLRSVENNKPNRLVIMFTGT
ncbi:MAG: response regulator [Candidatus Dadabacteria bacterium]|nr:response regulator [Candidatus Dadabacteria bacterium]